MHAMIQADKPLTIGRLAKATGLGVETLRYYEREHLIEPPPRSPSGYRHYKPETVNRIRFICRAKELGFTLREIRELLNLRNKEHATAGDFKSMAQSKIREVEAKIEDLQRMKQALRQLSGCCPGGEADRQECPILAALEGR